MKQMNGSTNDVPIKNDDDDDSISSEVITTTENVKNNTMYIANGSQDDHEKNPSTHKNKIDGNPTFDTNDDDTQSPKKKRKFNKELELLTRNEYRVDPNKIQLYASDYDNVSCDTNNHGRSKRLIKQVTRYVDLDLSYAEQLKLQQLTGKIGTGFLCPQCHEHLSYDVKKCYKCDLKCRYLAGTGVVVCRERNETTTLNISKPIDTEKEVGHSKEATNDKRVLISTEINKVSTRLSSKRKPEPVQTTIKGKKDEDTSYQQESYETNLNLKSYAKCDLVDAAECEACLKLYPPSYLQGHRLKLHNLSVREFGCPYCTSSTRFESMNERIQHMKKNHPNKPQSVSKSEKMRTKCYVYNCPMCNNSPLSYCDLKSHLRRIHSEEIDNVLDKVSSNCPFCMSSSSSASKHRVERLRFKTLEDLHDHISSSHVGCIIIGKKLKIGKGGSKTNRPMSKPKPVKVTPKRINQPKAIEKNTEGDSDTIFPVATIEEHQPLSNIDSLSSNEQWSYLSYEKLRDLLNADRSVLKRGKSYDEIVNIIDTKLDRFYHQANLEKKRRIFQNNNTGNDDVPNTDDEYAEENRVFNRGVRDRTLKAESEKLEKFKFKEKIEEMNHFIRWQNRTKKKTITELETENIIFNRFIHFDNSKSRASASKDVKCKTENCELCDGSYAKWIITDEELQDAGNDIFKAVSSPIINSMTGKSDILLPTFRKLSSDEDLPNDNSVEKKNEPKRYSSRNNDATTDTRKLLELKHCLEFCFLYNSGLITK